MSAACSPNVCPHCVPTSLLFLCMSAAGSPNVCPQCMPAFLQYILLFSKCMSAAVSPNICPVSVVFQMYGCFRICQPRFLQIYALFPLSSTCMSAGLQCLPALMLVSKKMYAAAVITFLQNVRRRRNVCQPFRNVCQLFRQVCPQMYVYLPHTNSNSPCFTVNACQPCVFPMNISCDALPNS